MKTTKKALGLILSFPNMLHHKQILRKKTVKGQFSMLNMQHREPSLVFYEANPGELKGGRRNSVLNIQHAEFGPLFSDMYFISALCGFRCGEYYPHGLQ